VSFAIGFTKSRLRDAPAAVSVNRSVKTSALSPITI
jgi:hypothetical protein